MGEDVEQAAAGSLGERLEVAFPDLLGAVTAIPDAVVVHVDRVIAQEVDGADDVVEVAALEQVGRAILGAGDEVGLDPEPQVGTRAHELAVGVDVVDRELAPQRVLPHPERLLEAVDVLGDAELCDPALLGDGAIAGDVLLGEVIPGAGAQVVRT